MLKVERYKRRGFYIEKGWFDNEDVQKFNSLELRLLILHSGRVIKDLDKEEKRWVLGKNNKIIDLEKAKEKLINLNLIELFDKEKANGYYSKVILGENKYEYVKFEDILKVKNLRQLLLVCVKNNSRELIVSPKLLDILFGVGFRGNENFKRTCKQLRFDIIKIETKGRGTRLFVEKPKVETQETEKDKGILEKNNEEKTCSAEELELFINNLIHEEVIPYQKV